MVCGENAVTQDPETVYLNTLHSFYHFTIKSSVCQGKLYNLTLFNNIYPLSMYKKTIDKEIKK